MLSIFSCVYYPSVCLWRNVCLGLFPTFWSGCLFFWFWVVWVACIFWKLILCQLFHLLWFSPVLRVILTLFIVSFAVQKILSLIRFHFFLFPLLWEVGDRGSCFDLCHQLFCLCFPLRVLYFLVLNLGLKKKFRSLIHLSLSLCVVLRSVLISFFLHVAVQFYQDHLLKRLSLLHCIFLPPLSKIRSTSVFLGFVSWSTGLYVCFCASTILSWLL